ncbi:hypothetical protein BUALT_Bualt07G0048900 [Buddleja alternifolia]|uniref:HMG box domain-containing protein n=1 Tax=Buddleja alternifolia TaxID=168488 RepID=A0AAV6X9K7_9LAMI|nr:hypothetical protein BUALT_Bualt07G0048900 [Buddleja alternifolia]
MTSCQFRCVSDVYIYVLWLVEMKTGSMSRGAVRKETKEVLKPIDDRWGKGKAAPKADKSMGKTEKKAKKDPNKPKRPPQCHLRIPEFWKSFNKEIPNVNGFSAVGKASGEKWRSLTETFYDLINIFELNGFPSEDMDP